MSDDLILRGGTVLDGTGAPRFQADIAIRAGRISAIGDLAGRAAAKSVDVGGLAVAPGFIDVHTHDDAALIEMPAMEMKASQGVTTVICGNCGASAAPYDKTRGIGSVLGLLFKDTSLVCATMGEFLGKVQAAKPAINGAFLVGHSTLRMSVLGDDLNRHARADEIKQMKSMLKGALDDGAIGMSSGLFYPPAMPAKTEELIDLVEPIGPAKGVYTAHIRDEGEHITEALEEAFAIGRAAGGRTIISHHKCNGRANFGRSPQTLAQIEAAMRSQPVGFDVYPYIAGSTILRPEMIERAEKVLITGSQVMPEARGRDLAELAAEMQLSPLEAAKRLVPGGAIYFMMDEGDVRRILSHEKAMIGSDGIPGDAHPHPRLWGTFPRVLGHYSRDLGLFSLEDAVRRMSGLSAVNFGLKDRGFLKPGAFADICVFDPATIIDTATFEKPIQPAKGVHLVMANGVAVWQDGRATGNRPGKVLRRQDQLAA